MTYHQLGSWFLQERSLISKNEISKIKVEVRQMMETCFYKESCYWRSVSSSHLKKSCLVRIANFKQVNRFGINFCKYHEEGIGIIKSLPLEQRYFCQISVNKYSKFSVWTCHVENFKQVITQLHTCPDIRIEFIIPNDSNELTVPELFKPLLLDYELKLP